MEKKMTDRNKILDKIKKCLALSASSNEHEAEAALRQARKLMEAHDITEVDVLAAQAAERRTKAGAARRPSNWETMLGSKVAAAFGCRMIFIGGGRGMAGDWCFIGCGINPEIADYAFTVLQRQVKRARGEHIKTRLKRCKLATKTRRADLFCEGWVRSVAGAIEVFAQTDGQTGAVEAYVAANYPTLGNLKSLDRNDGRRLSDHEHNDYAAGHRSGKDVQLNRGIRGADQHLALGY